MNEFVVRQSLASITASATCVLASEVTGVNARIDLVDEGASTTNPTTMSAVTTGYPVNGCGNACGGLDNAANGGYDIWSGVTVSNGVVANSAKSGAANATGGTYARHDPQTNIYQGGSEYLLADGHVKFMRAQYVATSINPCSLATSAAMGIYAAAYCTQ